MSLCISVCMCLLSFLYVIIVTCGPTTYFTAVDMFMSFCFLSSRTKYSPFSLEQLLSACNVFSSSVGSNARGRLCRLGEDLVQPVMQV